MSLALGFLFADFQDAVLTGDASVATPLIRHNPRLAPARQLAIYIDGYRLRLLAAIRADYPGLLALVGDEVFDRLALDYIENHPPQHFNLDRYPHGFAAYVCELARDEFAAEIAILEGAISEVFMMEESEPLLPSMLASMTLETFGAMTLQPRLASRLLPFSYPAGDWLDEQRAGHAPARPAPESSFMYLYRHRHNVQRAPLPEAAYRLLERLFKGLPVAEALDATMTAYPASAETIAANLKPWFAEWVGSGFFRC